ncbi:MAG: (deoxy)nucleoside triphosphate pyrophosphohydrolase [Alphaproteobacteria bacterium]|nr:(deoxy)nucleoside triphosphate pyrophosphohydrolase [Alphaproteobacteria bacterium]MBQ9234909.1 (deoxy)nucleoside triphosphate pyrophosphohydrolase [Alphaproteobacteria bacterium]
MKHIQVAAAVLQKDGKIFIAQRPANKLPPLKWEFPGGKPEAGETLPQALKRELREELGIETVIGDFIAQTTYIYDFAQVEINLFYATMQDENVTIVDTEHTAVAWVFRNELSNYDFAPADIPLLKHLTAEI